MIEMIIIRVREMILPTTDTWARIKICVMGRSGGMAVVRIGSCTRDCCANILAPRFAPLMSLHQCTSTSTWTTSIFCNAVKDIGVCVLAGLNDASWTFRRYLPLLKVWLPAEIVLEACPTCFQISTRLHSQTTLGRDLPPIEQISNHTGS